MMRARVEVEPSRVEMNLGEELNLLPEALHCFPEGICIIELIARADWENGVGSSSFGHLEDFTLFSHGRFALFVPQWGKGLVVGHKAELGEMACADATLIARRLVLGALVCAMPTGVAVEAERRSRLRVGQGSGVRGHGHVCLRLRVH